MLMLRPKIENLIKESGLRKDFVAAKLRTSTRMLRKYEKGESIMPMEKAYILARLLGVRVDDLYEYEEDESS
jgi:transcriptional regulator with XRE-family HTH domain